MICEFYCKKCCSHLQLIGKVRPICRVCGAQMKLAGKVQGEDGPVSYKQIQDFNLLNGYSRSLNPIP